MTRHTISLTRLSLAIALLIASAARADDVSAPIRSQQEPTPIWQERSQTMELPTSPSNPVLEIPGQEPDSTKSLVLPSPFVGCWEGTIEGFDTVTPIGFMSSSLRGARATYTFCYLPNPDGKTYRLEFRKLVIDDSELTPTAFENQILWVDDASHRGYLRNHLSVVQTSWLLIFPIHIHEEIYAEQIATLRDQNSIGIRGAELIRMEGKDYARTEFHADFHRIPEN